MHSDRAGEREMEIVGFEQVSPLLAQVGLREKGGTRLCALHCDPWSALGIIQGNARLVSSPSRVVSRKCSACSQVGSVSFF